MGSGLWDRLVEPGASVEEPGDRRTARLLASVLVVLIPTSIVSAFAQLALVPGFWPIFLAIGVGVAAFAVAYVLSRGRHFRTGALLTTGALTVESLVSAATGPRPEVSFAFVLLGPILASFLLSARETVVLASVGLVGATVACVLDPRISGAEASSILSLQAVVAALLVVGRHHRDRVEADRRASLARSEERSRLLLETTFDAVLLTKDRRVVVASAGCERLFARALVGVRVDELFEGELSVDAESGHVEALGRAQDRRFPAEVVFHSGPDAVCAIAVRDVSERRLLEARLRLENRLAALGTLTAGVAHELNNPLAYAGLNVEMAIKTARRAENDELLDCLVHVQEGLDRMASIVRSLRTFARNDEAELGPIDLADVVRSTLRMIGIRLVDTRVELEVAEDVPPVEANAARLGQVFTNLVLNAVQATSGRPDPTVRVSVESDAARVHVTVEDNGVGIPSSELERIFDPFFTTKPVGEGTGLGLAICHGIVKAYGGSIRAESTPGVGTRFHVDLPHAA